MSKPKILEIEKKTVLYESETGTTGNVTLSDSVANYDYIEIQCKRKVGDEDILYGTGRLYKTNGKTVSISANYTTSSAMYVYAKTVTINGNSINVVRANFSTGSTVNTDDSNYITRVVGYKVL